MNCLRLAHTHLIAAVNSIWSTLLGSLCDDCGYCHVPKNSPGSHVFTSHRRRGFVFSLCICVGLRSLRISCWRIHVMLFAIDSSVSLCYSRIQKENISTPVDRLASLYLSTLFSYYSYDNAIGFSPSCIMNAVNWLRPPFIEANRFLDFSICRNFLIFLFNG